jgi:hypothetical protein
MTYKLTTDWPQNTVTGAFVNPETNTEYLAWLSEGNTPEPADQPSPNDLIIKQIADLEATQTPRRVREGGQWMIDLEAQIAALREQLV